MTHQQKLARQQERFASLVKQAAKERGIDLSGVDEGYLTDGYGQETPEETLDGLLDMGIVKDGKLG